MPVRSKSVMANAVKMADVRKKMKIMQDFKANLKRGDAASAFSNISQMKNVNPNTARVMVDLSRDLLQANFRNSLSRGSVEDAENVIRAMGYIDPRAADRWGRILEGQSEFFSARQKKFAENSGKQGLFKSGYASKGAATSPRRQVIFNFAKNLSRASTASRAELEKLEADMAEDIFRMKKIDPDASELMKVKFNRLFGNKPVGRTIEQKIDDFANILKRKKISMKDAISAIGEVRESNPELAWGMMKVYRENLSSGLDDISRKSMLKEIEKNPVKLRTLSDFKAAFEQGKLTKEEARAMIKKIEDDNLRDTMYYILNDTAQKKRIRIQVDNSEP